MSMRGDTTYGLSTDITGYLRILQLNKFPVDFQEISRRHFNKLSVGYCVVTV